MSNLYRLLTVLLAAFSLVSTPVSAADSTELEVFKEEIRKKYDLKERGYATNDAELIVTQFYAPEGVVSTGEGYDVYLGSEGLRRVFAAVIKYTVEIESVHTHVNGDMGYDWANYLVYDENKEEPFEKYRILFLWEKIDGEWFVKGDMYVFGTFDKS